MLSANVQSKRGKYAQMVCDPFNWWWQRPSTEISACALQRSYGFYFEFSSQRMK